MLICTVLRQRGKRVVLMAAHSPAALDRSAALLQPSAGELAFPRPGTGQVDHIQVGCGQINRGTQRPQQLQRCLTAVYKLYRTGNDIPFLIHGITQDNIQLGIIIAENQLQGIRFFCRLHIHRGQSGKRWFTRHSLIACVTQLSNTCSVFQLRLIGRNAKIPRPVLRVFLRQAV
ncbi:hypothetical protein D3C73_790820 [compost metagenome]